MLVPLLCSYSEKQTLKGQLWDALCPVSALSDGQVRLETQR